MGSHPQGKNLEFVWPCVRGIRLPSQMMVFILWSIWRDGITISLCTTTMLCCALLCWTQKDLTPKLIDINPPRCLLPSSFYFGQQMLLMVRYSTIHTKKWYTFSFIHTKPLYFIQHTYTSWQRPFKYRSNFTRNLILYDIFKVKVLLNYEMCKHYANWIETLSWFQKYRMVGI